eukprot:1856536-Pleurochrysis_carterae.AAC.1
MPAQLDLPPPLRPISFPAHSPPSTICCSELPAILEPRPSFSLLLAHSYSTPCSSARSTRLSQLTPRHAPCVRRRWTTAYSPPSRCSAKQPPPPMSARSRRHTHHEEHSQPSKFLLCFNFLPPRHERGAGGFTVERRLSCCSCWLALFLRIRRSCATVFPSFLTCSTREGSLCMTRSRAAPPQAAFEIELQAAQEEARRKQMARQVPPHPAKLLESAHACCSLSCERG